MLSIGEGLTFPIVLILLLHAHSLLTSLSCVLSGVPIEEMIVGISRMNSYKHDGVCLSLATDLLLS